MTEPAVHVFAGPSIPHRRVRELLPNAHVHPPVEHGAVLRLPLRAGDAVAIIDGVFFQAAPVRHKELLHLLDRGVLVYGASSMGALRAAELAPMGMRGVGVVFRLYSSGLLDRDDEVAVVHATAADDFIALSDALVSIRVAARHARVRGVIDRTAEQLIVETAAALPFPARRHASAVRHAYDRGLPAVAGAAYLEYAAQAVSVKRADAEMLLRLLATVPTPPSAGSPEHPTVFLAEWLRAFRGTVIDAEHVTDQAVLTCCKLFADDYPRFHRARVLRALAGPSVTDDPEPRALGYAEARGLRPGNGPVEALVRTYRWAPGVSADDMMIEALRPTAAWAHAQGIALRARKCNAQLAEAGYRLTNLSVDQLRKHFAGRWDCDDLDLAVLDRGFASTREFVEHAAPFLPLARLHGVESFTVLG